MQKASGFSHVALVIIVALAVLSSGGFFVYQKYQKQESAKLPVVPGENIRQEAAEAAELFEQTRTMPEETPGEVPEEKKPPISQPVVPLLVPSRPPIEKETASSPPSTKGPADTLWKIPQGNEKPLRAVHMTGKWGATRDFLEKGEYPEEYFEFLRDMAVNWVGISVAVHVEDSIDDSVERKFSGVENPSFTDEELRTIINKLHQHGFKVYLTLAYQDEESTKAAKPVRRWQIGDPKEYLQDPAIERENWPWALDHPKHEEFVRNFWESYTRVAAQVGALAEELGVEMYSLGTETDRLFRTRAGGYWPNHFGRELKTLVSRVREVYRGILTYDQHADSLIYDHFHPGSKYLFEDLELDVVGISGYFALAQEEPKEVMGTAELEAAWQKVFGQYLIPLKERNHDKPLYFIEVGYMDLMSAPLAQVGPIQARTFGDRNGNGVDDGEETQANIYQALFNAMDKNPDVLDGAFLWEVHMSTRSHWRNTIGRDRNMHFLDKPAEAVVREIYYRWRERL